MTSPTETRGNGFSLIIPVYKNEDTLDRLLPELAAVHSALLPLALEVVFVVDGSPDRCHAILAERLPTVSFPAQLVSLSRNFGSFPAIAAGLSRARGDFFAVIAADLQEPPDLVLEFARILSSDEAEICFGVRASRSDGGFADLSSNIFWALYRRFVIAEMPAGGIDVFGCNRQVRDRLVAMPEATTNLIALLFWFGFRRRFVPYQRQPRVSGRSAWTFYKKLRYAIDSIFNFTDLPIQGLLAVGLAGSTLAAALGLIVLTARAMGSIEVPGYTALALIIMFFGGLTTFGLGVVGQYLWLTLQNVRRRPNFVIESVQQFAPAPERK